MRAFQRLQEEIIKVNPDMSLFCWRARLGEVTYRGLLAHSPVEFASYYDTAQKVTKRESRSLHLLEFSVTNKGIRIEAEIVKMMDGAALKCDLPPDGDTVFVPMRYCRNDIYVRERPDLILFHHWFHADRKVIYIAKDADSQTFRSGIRYLHPTLMFIVAPLPALFRFEPVKGWPTLQWVSSLEHFLIPNDSLDIYIVHYQITYGGRGAGRFLAIYERRRAVLQPLRYALVSKYEAEEILQKLEGSAKGYSEVCSSVERFISTGRYTVEVEFESTILDLLVSECTSNNRQQLDTIHISLTNIDVPALSERADTSVLNK